jgi:hypothetical protein
MRARTLAIALAIASCKNDTPDAPVAGKGSQGSAVTAPAGALEIFVDGKSVAHVTDAQLETWPRLDTLVPVTARRLGTWEDVSITGAESKQLHKPSDAYRDLVPVLYAGDGGKPAFGMFDPVELANHGKPKLAAQGVNEVRITLGKGGGRGENESGDGGGNDPTKLKLAIKTPTGESVLDGKTLLAIPREAMPGDDSKDPRGWALATIMTAAGIKKFDKVMITDSAGQAVSLEASDFDAKTSIPFVKLNRSGGLRLTVYKKQGEGWQRGAGLKGVAAIEVLK